MTDPTNEHPGAIPPEAAKAGQSPDSTPDSTPGSTQGTTQADVVPATGDPTSDTAEAPTAAMAAMSAPAAPAAGAPPSEAWYRRRWAIIAGAAAGAAILLLGGVAIGTAVAGDGRDGRGHGGPGMFRDGDGPGHGGWGDRDGQGRGDWSDRGTAPGMGHRDQGFGHDDGDDWGRSDDRDHPRGWQTPGATPAPSTTPQAP